MENAELTHHGIKGMHWGVRRTPEQLDRLAGRQETKSEKKERKQAVKRRRSMSDGEIKKRIARLQLEREYKDLSDSDVARGKKFVSEILSSAGKKVLTSAAAGAMAYGVKAAMTKEFNIKEAAQYIVANPNKKK